MPETIRVPTPFDAPPVPSAAVVEFPFEYLRDKPCERKRSTFAMIQLESAFIIVEDGVRTDIIDPDLEPREAYSRFEWENDQLECIISGRTADVNLLKEQLKLEDEKKFKAFRERDSMQFQFVDEVKALYWKKIEALKHLEKLRKYKLNLEKKRETAQRLHKLAKKRHLMSKKIKRMLLEVQLGDEDEDEIGLHA